MRAVVLDAAISRAFKLPMLAPAKKHQVDRSGGGVVSAVQQQLLLQVGCDGRLHHR